MWPPGTTTGPLVKLTNPDKVLYPATGTTKADVFRYYTTVAEAMVPHIAGRPATRKRWPNGVDATAFFEKELAKSAPAWLHRGTLAHRSGDTVYPIIDDSTGLAWIAQQAALEVHVPQWRFGTDGKPGPANRLVFDLDPGEGVSMATLCEVAHAVRELMDDIGLRVYPLTSGSKGLHLYVPLAEPVRSDGVVVLARRVAQQLEQSMPALVTATMTKSLRAGRVFLDWSQNNAAKTTIAPYSLQHVAQAVLDALPVAEFDVLGWSLGATVALEMARLSPQRIRSLCMLSANPCFVRQDSWPGMPAELLAVFMAQLQTKPAQTLSRFLALQVNESAEAKAVLQQLKTVMRECLTPEPEVLQAGLRMLADSDLRPTLTRLSCPLHLILGDRDSLIPLAAGQAMLALNSGMYLHVIETAGHVPFLSHQQLLLNILLAALSA